MKEASFFSIESYPKQIYEYSVKMNNLEYRTFKNFFILNSVLPIEIHRKLVKVYKQSVHSFSTVKKWVAEFKMVVHLFKIIHVSDGRKWPTMKDRELIQNDYDDRLLKVCEIAKASVNSEKMIHRRNRQYLDHLCWNYSSNKLS